MEKASNEVDGGLSFHAEECIEHLTNHSGLAISQMRLQPQQRARLVTVHLSNGADGVDSHGVLDIRQCIDQITQRFRPRQIPALNERENACRAKVYGRVLMATPDRFHLYVTG